MQDLGSTSANKQQPETDDELFARAVDKLRLITYSTTSDTLHFNTLIATQLLEQIIKELR